MSSQLHSFSHDLGISTGAGLTRGAGMTGLETFTEAQSTYRHEVLLAEAAQRRLRRDSKSHRSGHRWGRLGRGRASRAARTADPAGPASPATAGPATASTATASTGGEDRNEAADQELLSGWKTWLPSIPAHRSSAESPNSNASVR